MDQNAATEEGKVLKNGLELVKSVADKHLGLLRPSSCLFSMFKGYTSKNNDREKGKYAHINDNGFSKDFMTNRSRVSVVESDGFRFGFPLMWYYATFLYLGSYCRKDPRERAGLAASAIAAMGFSVILFIVSMIFYFSS